MTVPASSSTPAGTTAEATVALDRTDDRRAGLRRVDVTLAGAVLAAWGVLIVVAWRLGLDDRIEWKLRAAPIAGFFDRHVSIGTLVALGVGLAGARLLPAWAERAPWRRLLVLTPALAALWGGLLALTRGLDGLSRGLGGRLEYPAVAAEVDRLGLARFIETFADVRVLSGYPIHVQGHPVGASLLYWTLDVVGLRGAGWAAAASIAIGATTWAAVLLVVREVADEARARALAPFLVLVPAAVWMVASADAVFAAAGAWGIALVVLATRGGRPARSAAGLALAAGLVWGVGIQLTYGLGPVLLVGAVVVLARRRWTLLGWTALGGLAVTGLVALAGFWWFDGLAATHERYHAGIAELRPRGFFTFVGNPAAFALAVGPAAVVAFALVRDRRLWLLGGAGLLAVGVANASGLSKAEVERIWLPFVPWVLVPLGGIAARSHRAVPVLLSAQVLVAVAVESLVKTPW